MKDDSNKEIINSVLLSVGINPRDNQPYIHDPQALYDREKPFLDSWWDNLSDDRKDRFNQIRDSMDRENVVSIGFTDERGIDYKVDKNGYIVKEVYDDKVVTKSDLVNSPPHYTNGKIEAVDYLRDNMPIEAFIGGCEWNVKKYLHRWRYKGKPLEDLKKAQWYLNLWIEAMEGK